MRSVQMLALLSGASLLSASISQALAAYEQEVQDVYIGYYGRAADPEGLAYWANLLEGYGGDLNMIIDAFGNSEEFRTRYGSLSDASLIDGLYQQAFGRSAESQGIAYYTDLLNGTNNSGLNGELRQTSLAAIALDILNGAQGADATVIANKRDVAAAYTETMEAMCAPYTLGHAFGLLGTVDSTEVSVTTAKAEAMDFLGENAEYLCFSSVPAPETDAEKRAILASDSVRLGVDSFDIDYNTIFRSGEEAGGGVFGKVYNKAGDPIVLEDGSEMISDSNDFSSLLPYGDKVFMISGFESKPGQYYVTELDQEPLTGILSPLATKPIDVSANGGVWMHCAGSVTPWNTHLGSEEYEPNARDWDPATGDLPNNSDWTRQQRYFTDPTEPTPYNYGFLFEAVITGDDLGTGTFAENVEYTKHYAAGRMAIELGYVMPDEKTVYISDDGTNVGLFRFVADTAGDLSSGTLYAARWVQTSASNGGSAAIVWIDLGHATSAEIAQHVNDRITFDDMFETADPVDGTCPGGFASVNTTWGHECLMVKTGMEKAASRLETRRYAAMLGATTEFRKMEGITHDPDMNVMYLAMSEVAQGMEDNMKNGAESDRYDVGSGNHIKLPYNLCGAVYALDLDSEYTAYNMYGIVSGRMTQAYDENSSIPAYTEDGPFADNKCDLNSIANPDNITFLPGYNTMIIGEDTGSGHQNDVLWAYNFNTERLTRIQTTPYGAETTSPYFYPDINGFSYIMSVVQHPYGESDENQLQDEDEGRAYTGFMGPMPALLP